MDVIRSKANDQAAVISTNIESSKQKVEKSPSNIPPAASIKSKCLTPKAVYHYDLNARPSALLYIEHRDAFIVGTYDLVDESSAKKWLPGVIDDELAQHLQAINHRTGSLYLFAKTHPSNGYSESTHHICELGGVFDMVKLDDDHQSHSFLVAHANGTIRNYVSSADTIEPGGDILKIVDDCSILITCIDVFKGPRPVDRTAVVGDSSGSITVISAAPEDQEDRATVKVCLDPIWQVRVIPQDSWPSSVESVGVVHMLVGAEDSCWYIYRLSYALDGADLGNSKLNLLYKNNDFTAGVTSICLRLPISPAENTGAFPLRVFIGSYDETIREYSLSDLGSDPRVEFLGAMKLAGAGIWRMHYTAAREWQNVQDRVSSQPVDLHHDKRVVQNQIQSSCDCLSVSTMYSKPAQILMGLTESKSLDPTHNVGESVKRLCNTIDRGEIREFTFELEESSDPLYYGFIPSRGARTVGFCLIDFNNRRCIFLDYAPHKQE